MSKADKIFDIAEKLGYEGDTEGSTADAINAVSDALGFDGPHKGRITSALADLYTVVDGGGGGGGSLGALQNWPFIGDTAPEVGSYPPAGALLATGIDIGDTPVIGGFLNFHADGLAAGATMRFYASTFTAAYIVTTDDDEAITAVENWDGVSAVSGEEDIYEFVMPTLQNTETAIGMIVIVGSQT